MLKDQEFSLGSLRYNINSIKHTQTLNYLFNFREFLIEMKRNNTHTSLHENLSQRINEVDMSHRKLENLCVNLKKLKDGELTLRQAKKKYFNRHSITFKYSFDTVTFWIICKKITMIFYFTKTCPKKYQRLTNLMKSLKHY